MRAARIKAGLTQSYLARKLSVSQQSYARYENSISEPSIEALEIICKEVHMTVPELLGIDTINIHNLFDINIHNLFEQFEEEEDFDQKSEGKRMGRRIRAIRQVKGLSRSELGKKVGLDENRIQQYENGFRKPKTELRKKIAEALEVGIRALEDPQIDSYEGAMCAFFEMEKRYDLRLKEVDGQIHICFGESSEDPRDSAMNKNLETWYKHRKAMEESIINAETEEEKKQIFYEYCTWEWNFL